MFPHLYRRWKQHTFLLHYIIFFISNKRARDIHFTYRRCVWVDRSLNLKLKKNQIPKKEKTYEFKNLSLGPWFFTSIEWMEMKTARHSRFSSYHENLKSRKKRFVLCGQKIMIIIWIITITTHSDTGRNGKNGAPFS